MSPPLTAVLLVVVATVTTIVSTASSLSIGVNYGNVADNLPPPQQVAAFLRDKTFIDRVKLFDANPDFIRAFAGTGISVIITAPNGDIPSLASRRSSTADAWVAANVSPFHPATNISLILVGNEILATSDRNLIGQLVPAMRALSSALARAGFPSIRVSTPHSLGILSATDAPSSGRFRKGYDRSIFAPMLQFHRDTGSPFVVNAYPYFGYNGTTLNYATFRPNAGVYDPDTKMNYTNMFDAQMDAVYSAMKKIGFGDVEIAVGETGWPSMAEAGQVGVSVDDAASYNGNLIQHVNSGKGTPLMPGRRFETYIFSLFNEDLKPGPIAERNWGLFNADLSPVYDVGLMRGGQSGGGPPPKPTPAPVATKSFCVAKKGASEATLQSNIDYACGPGGVDCSAIQSGGPCFNPNTKQSHASYVMNAFYQKSGRHSIDCDFAGTGLLVTADPSYAACKYSTRT